MKGNHYTWRTVQDSKVRSSHADREGKVFSWTDPPDGGHPGEAYNCRCWAENLEAEKTDREEGRLAMAKAWTKHDDLQYPILDAREDISAYEKILKNLKIEQVAIWARIGGEVIPDGVTPQPSLGPILGAELT